MLSNIILNNDEAESNLSNNNDYVVRHYSDMIYGIALSQLKNVQDAEGALQETFFIYFKKNKRFNDEEHRKAWLIRVALNVCKHIISYNRRHYSISIDDVDVSYNFETEEDNLVYTALVSLSEKYKTVLYLYYIEEESAKSIAGILKISEANVFMRLSRGRTMLKEKLKGDFDL